MRYVVILGLMLFVMGLHSQTYNDPPVSVEFDGLEPIWQVPIPNLSADSDRLYEYYYSGGVVSTLDLSNQTLTAALYLKTDSALYDGMTLFKLDLASGDILAHFGFNYLTDTIRVADTGIFYYNDEIIVTGCAHLNPDSITPIGIPYRACQPFVRRVDGDFGDYTDVLNDEINPDFARVSASTIEILPISDGTYRLIRRRSSELPMLIRYDLDQALSFVSDPDTLIYATPIPPERSQVDIHLNSFYQDEVEAYYFMRDGAEYPVDASIETYDLLDPDTEISRRVDLTEYTKYPHPSTISGLRWIQSDDVTILSRVSFSNVTTPFATAWHTWIEGDDVISHVSDIGIDSHYYLSITEIDLDPDRLYAFAYPSITGKDGYDVIKITREGSIELVGDMIVDQPDYRFVSNIEALLIGDEVLVFGRVINSDGTQALNMQAVKLAAEDLGITEITSTTDLQSTSAKTLAVYPTLADQVITLEVPEESLSARIFDQQMQLVEVLNLEKGVTSLSVDAYRAGHYVLQAYSEESGKRYRSQFIVVR